jgi:predicted PurR-regulated permease PerM
MAKGVGLVLFGFFILVGMDSIVKAKLIGGKGRINPAVVLVGALGGLFVFGLLGAFVGPIILAVFITILKINSEMST